MQRQLLLVQYKQQASLLLSMNKFTPFEISRNDKNKQLAIIKAMQIGINRTVGPFCIIKSSGPPKNLKTSRVP